MKPLSEQSFYEILDVPVEATPKEIERAFERAMAFYGPDSPATYSLADPAQTRELVGLLEEAFLTLSDPQTRSAYDRGVPSGPASPAPRLLQPEKPPREAHQLAFHRILESSRVYPWPGSRPQEEVEESAAAPTLLAQSAPPAVAKPAPATTAPAAPIPFVAESPATIAPAAPIPFVAELAAHPAAPIPFVAESPAPAAATAAPATIAPAAPIPFVAELAAPPAAPIPFVAESPASAAATPAPPVIAPAAPSSVAPKSAPIAALGVPSPEAPGEPAPIPRPVPEVSSQAEMPAASAIAAAFEPAAAPPVEPGPALPAVVALTVAEPPGLSPASAAAPVPQAEPPAKDPVPPPEEPASLPPPPKPAAKMPEIGPGAAYNGELLRRVRQARGLTLREVSERTRIGLSHLENVEADHYLALPVTVYLRGFLMSLARELRLDPLKVSKSYLDLVTAAKSRPKG